MDLKRKNSNEMENIQIKIMLFNGPLYINYKNEFFYFDCTETSSLIEIKCLNLLMQLRQTEKGWYAEIEEFQLENGQTYNFMMKKVSEKGYPKSTLSPYAKTTINLFEKNIMSILFAMAIYKKCNYIKMDYQTGKFKKPIDYDLFEGAYVTFYAAKYGFAVFSDTFIEFQKKNGLWDNGKLSYKIDEANSVKDRNAERAKMKEMTQEEVVSEWFAYLKSNSELPSLLKKKDYILYRFIDQKSNTWIALRTMKKRGLFMNSDISYEYLEETVPFKYSFSGDEFTITV